MRCLAPIEPMLKGVNRVHFRIRQEILTIQDFQHLELSYYQAILNGPPVALSLSLMTLKIEQFSGSRGTRIRLHGELRAEHLDELGVEIERSHPRVTLDLDEVDLVDIDAVRFLNGCEAQAVEVVNCSRYIQEWMSQERGREKI